MTTKSMAENIADKLVAQKKVVEEIAQLKREQAKQGKPKRQKLKRHIGRLAIQCGLYQFTQDELSVVSQKAERELRETRQKGRRPSAQDRQ